MTVRYRSNWTLKELVLRRGENLRTQRKTSHSKGENQQQTKNWFRGEGKPEDPEKNLSEQGREPTKNKELVLRTGENLSTRRKTSQSKGENQEQTEPKYEVDAWI